VKKQNHRHSRNIMIYKAKQFMMTKHFQGSLHILEDGASGVKIGNIEQVIV